MKGVRFLIDRQPGARTGADRGHSDASEAVPLNPLYTIGYSTRPIEGFLDALQAHSITVVCDVRSSPFSKRNPAFSRDELRMHLRRLGIKYVFLGDELGARPPESDCYVNGQARYELLAKRPAFQAGIQRLLTGLKTYRPVIMCAEREPIECHRTILVCRHLVPRSVEIRHIVEADRFERHVDLERRLVRLLKLEPLPMFASPETWSDAISKAYELQGRKIAYVEKEAPSLPLSRVI